MTAGGAVNAAERQVIPLPAFAPGVRSRAFRFVWRVTSCAVALFVPQVRLVKLRREGGAETPSTGVPLPALGRSQHRRSVGLFPLLDPTRFPVLRWLGA